MKHRRLRIAAGRALDQQSLGRLVLGLDARWSWMFRGRRSVELEERLVVLGSHPAQDPPVELKQNAQPIRLSRGQQGRVIPVHQQKERPLRGQRLREHGIDRYPDAVADALMMGVLHMPSMQDVGVTCIEDRARRW